MYILNTLFEWDPRKAGSNLAKHGVSFEEAATIFTDPDALDGPGYSATEARFLRVGRSTDGRVLVAAYTIRGAGDGQAIRIFSARRASRQERVAYAPQD